MCETIDLVEKVELKGAKLVPLFITVDPDRDDVKTVNKYLKGFDLSKKFMIEEFKIYFIP